MRPPLSLAVRHIAHAHPKDIRSTTMLVAMVTGTVTLVFRLGRLSRDVKVHARDVAKLWAETDDIRTKLLTVGEDFVDALSSPPPSPGDQR